MALAVGMITPSAGVSLPKQPAAPMQNCCAVCSAMSFAHDRLLRTALGGSFEEQQQRQDGHGHDEQELVVINIGDYLCLLRDNSVECCPSRRRVKLTDIGERSLRDTADHVGVLGKTHSGAVFTADISGGVAPEDALFSLDVRGSKGWLSLTSRLSRPGTSS